MKHGDKMDVYDFGVILLEIITGRQLNSENEVNTLKDQVKVLKQHLNFYLDFILLIIIKRYKNCV